MSNEELAGQYLTFTLRQERFALPIGKVKEVIDLTAMTKVPRMPDYMSGVLNLRGNVLPVIDLGLKLGMAPIDTQATTSIMIVTIGYEGMAVEVALLTDSVQRVVDLTPDEILPPPTIGAKIQSIFISGIGHQEDGYFLLLLIDAVIGNKILKEPTQPSQEGF